MDLNRALTRGTIKLIEDLPGWTMVAPLFVDVDGISGFFKELVNLDKAQRDLVVQTLSSMRTSSEDGKLLVLFRGDNRYAVGKRLFRGAVSEVAAFETLFYIGEKSKHFYKTNADNLRRLSHFRHIEDTSSETYSYIYERITSALASSSWRTTNQKRRLIRFLEDNPNFVSFFQGHNRDLFVGSCLAANTGRTRLRDYYLYLLHTLGRLGGISDLSFFVSTSRDYDQSLRFAGGNATDSQFVFLYFIPMPFADYGVDKVTVQASAETVSEVDLPTYSTEIYPEQREFAVKGGLFPHFLVGVIEPDKRRFVVNNHLFDNDNSDVYRNTVEGLRVNQSDFMSLLRRSGYVGYLQRHWSGAYSSHLTGR